MKGTSLIVLLVVFSLFGAWIGSYTSEKSLDSATISNQGLVKKKDLQILIKRTELSSQPYLQSILLSVQGALVEGTLDELANYTAAYSEHAIKEHPHRKIEKSMKSL